VVYCALDQEHSERILRLFEERTGLEVEAQFDVERNKTVGLVQRILAEREHPHADVFWNNEIAQTIRLQLAGATAPWQGEMAAGIPAGFRDPAGHWIGFAARARVILYRPDAFPEEFGPPRRLDDMLDPRLAPLGGMALPLTGTTLTHFTVLSLRRGDAAVLEWLRTARERGLRFGGGNADVMRRVCEGDLAWCLTDTDDAAVARDNGYPVEILFPDQGPGESGTLLIPNTACLLAGAPHPENAARFLEFLVSPEVEALLADGRSRQMPLRPGVRTPPDLPLPGRDFRIMDVDWQAVGAAIDGRRRAFKELLLQ